MPFPYLNNKDEQEENSTEDVKFTVAVKSTVTPVAELVAQPLHGCHYAGTPLL